MTEVDQLTEVSPTLVIAIQRCGLAVHLSRRRRQVSDLASGPPARLGRAVHRVLAWVPENRGVQHAHPDFEAAVRERWADEIAVEEKTALSNTRERYFGAATQWPGYATVSERLVIEAGRLAVELESKPPQELWIERQLRGTETLMKGSPDLVFISEAVADVVEYKSGEVSEEDALPSGRYGLQVALYAALVEENGVEVRSGELRPIGRRTIGVEVGAAAIEHAREVATTTLAAFNTAVSAGDTIHLAKPSDGACSSCAHVLECAVLWSKAGIEKLEQLQLVEGEVTRVQRTQTGSIALQVNVSAGTRTGVVTLTGLDPRRLSALDGLKQGDYVRVTGLHPGNTDSTLIVRSGSWVQLRTSPSELKCD